MVARWTALAFVLATACGGGNHASDPDGSTTGSDSGLDTTPPPPCGNSVLDLGEQCDDGNPTANDGCSATCTVEQGWICPTLGAPCLREVYCGDGLVEPPEQCDDGNSIPGDGCSGTCQVEPNFICP